MTHWPRNIATPPPRPVPWTMKSIDSARTELRFLPDRRLHLHVRHDVLAASRPRYSRGGSATCRERSRSRDTPGHATTCGIPWITSPSATPGDCPTDPSAPAQIHIQEASGGDPRYLVAVVTTIERLDEGGFVHAPWVGGIHMASLEYAFMPVPGGTFYENSITFGPRHPVVRAWVNRFVRPRMFPDDKARAWLRHNVEEVGSFEHFLPALYRASVAEDATRQPV